MTSWNAGYVADVEYIEGFYPHQSPARMALACLIGSIACDLPGPLDDVHYLELGCGRGMGALMIAASNPGWHVTAIDYNPTHVAMGVATAKAAGIENIRFLEADLTTLAGSTLAKTIPLADFVSMHGVWSWVGVEVRAGIVRLLAETVRPGGVVHVSYNAMPAWQGALGMQRIIYEGGMRNPGRSDRKASAGLALVLEMNEAKARYINDIPIVRDLIAAKEDLSLHYLSHEYMNAHWAPAFHADVAAALADAKLEWVASANPLENFPQLMLDEAQRALLDRFDDPIMRELIKDTCVPRQFRHDVFVRGARRILNSERDRVLSAMTLMPIVTPAELKTTIQVPAGQAEMSEELKLMMTAAMRGPATVETLLAESPGRSNPSELTGVLVGSLQSQIAPSPGAEQPDAANRLNRLIGSRVRSLIGPASSGGLASVALGTGLATPKLVQFVAARLLEGEREDAMPQWIETLGSDVAPEKQDNLRDMVQTVVEQRIPVLRQIGIVPS